MMESLEHRALLNSAPAMSAAAELGRRPEAALVEHARAATTRTFLRVHAGALGQGVTFTAFVRAAASQGAPQGTVSIVDHGSVIQTLTLTPASSPSARFAMSTATFTIPAGAGGPAYYFGPHAVSAVYTSSDGLRSSHANAHFRVATPHFTRLSNGLKIATVESGSGPGITAGQTAYMLYTGYLVRGGKIFDDSAIHGGAPFGFTVEASPEQVIPGFDIGTVGMQLGETRVLEIPAKLGYGRTGAPPTIPPNANLVFLITLVGIA